MTFHHRKTIHPTRQNSPYITTPGLKSLRRILQEATKAGVTFFIILQKICMDFILLNCMCIILNFWLFIQFFCRKVGQISAKDLNQGGESEVFHSASRGRNGWHFRKICPI